MLGWVCATPAKSSSCSCWRSVLSVLPAHDALAVGAATANAAARRLRNTVGGRAVVSSINDSRNIIMLSSVGAAAY